MKRPKKTAQTKAMTPWSKAGGRRCTRAILPASDQKKFTEPVALSSTFPGNLRLPPTTLGSGFDLLALRARCKREPRRIGRCVQVRSDEDSRYLRVVSSA